MTSVAFSLARARDSFRQLGRTSDYLVSFGTEGISLALGLVVFKLAAVYWGPVGFGEYVLSRRAISLLALPLSCGMAVGITRYVASGPQQARSHTLAALAIVAATCLAGLGILNVIPAQGAQLFFGDTRYSRLVAPISAAIVGMVLHGVAYGLLRGRMRIVQANILQFTNLAALPLMVFALGGLTVAGLLIRLGVLWTATSLVAIGVGLRGTPAHSSSSLSASARELLRYGVPRVPGELALAALFALPPIAAAHLGSIETAGHVGFATSLLTMIGSSFAPLGVVMLPAVSAAIASKRTDTLWHDSLRIVAVCAAAAGALILVLEVGAGLIVRYGLGPEFVAATVPVRIIVLGGIPYVVYVVLRNVLDAASVRPLNARNLLAALVVFAAAGWLLRDASLIPWVLLASVVLLGLLTLRDARRVLRDGHGIG